MNIETAKLNDNFSRRHNEQAHSTPDDTVMFDGREVTIDDLGVTYNGNGDFDLPEGAAIEPGSDHDAWVLTMPSKNQYHIVTTGLLN